jgi:hypothetical protein
VLPPHALQSASMKPSPASTSSTSPSGRRRGTCRGGVYCEIDEGKKDRDWRIRCGRKVCLGKVWGGNVVHPRQHLPALHQHRDTGTPGVWHIGGGKGGQGRGEKEGGGGIRKGLAA